MGSTDVSLLGTEAPYAELVAKEAGRERTGRSNSFVVGRGSDFYIVHRSNVMHLK